MSIAGLVAGIGAVANAVANASKNNSNKKKGQSVTANKGNSDSNSSRGSSSSSSSGANKTTSQTVQNTQNNAGPTYTYSWKTPTGIRYTTSKSSNYKDAAKEAGVNLNNWSYVSSKRSESNNLKDRPDMDYSRGNNYTNRGTTYTFQTPDGVKTVTTSDTNYRDAAQRMGIDLSNSKLLNATSYFDNRGVGSRPGGVQSGGGGWGMEGAGDAYDRNMQILDGLAQQYGMPRPWLGETGEAGGSLTQIANQMGISLNPNLSFGAGNYDLPAYQGMTADDIQEMYGDIYAAQEEQAEDQLDFLRRQYAYYNQVANDNYDSQAQQQYVQYMLGLRNAPQLLSAAGLSGGATETSLLGMQADYQNALNSVEQARTEALAQNQLQQAQAETEVMNNLASAYASLQQSAVSAIMQAQQAENAYNQWAAEYVQSRTEAERQYALQMMQMAQEEARYQQEVARQSVQDAQELALQRAQYGDYSGLTDLGWDMSQAEQDRALELAMNRAEYGDFSGLAALGWDVSDLQDRWDLETEGMRLDNQYQQAQIANYGRSRSSSGGSSRSESEPEALASVSNLLSSVPEQASTAGSTFTGPSQASAQVGDLVFVQGLGAVSQAELNRLIEAGDVEVYQNEAGGYLYRAAR